MPSASFGIAVVEIWIGIPAVTPLPTVVAPVTEKQRNKGLTPEPVRRRRRAVGETPCGAPEGCL